MHRNRRQHIKLPSAARVAGPAPRADDAQDVDRLGLHRRVRHAADHQRREDGRGRRDGESAEPRRDVCGGMEAEAVESGGDEGCHRRGTCFVLRWRAAMWVVY